MGYSVGEKSLFAAIACCVLALVACGEPLPGKNTAFVDEIPDVNQTAARGSVYGDGQQFCAPAAAANSLSWLVGRPDHADSLMKQLSSKEFMNTSLENGTGASGFLLGVDRYARVAFGGYQRLELRGWRSVKKALKSFRTSETITPEWLAKGVGKKSAVWINIGWYRHKQSTNEYKRIGGHWVTLVGYDFSDGRHLIIHDPAPRAGQNFANHSIAITKIWQRNIARPKNWIAPASY